MIYGSIDEIRTEAAFSPSIRKAFKVLRETDFASMEKGTYPLDDDRLILQIHEIETSPKETRRAEVHVKYVDLQYIISGQELIGCYPDKGVDKVEEDLLSVRDILFYEYRDNPDEVMLPMKSGNFALFFPEDVHRPSCDFNGSHPVRKVVLKIKVDSL